MTNHDYLVLGMAALWIVTNFLGAAFTIRYVRLHPKRVAFRCETGVRISLLSAPPGLYFRIILVGFAAASLITVVGISAREPNLGTNLLTKVGVVVGGTLAALLKTATAN